MTRSMTRARPFVLLARLPAVLALLAVLVRVVVPAGFMAAAPGQVAAGAIPIVLCTGQGQVYAFLTEDGDIIAADEGAPSPGDGEGAASHGDCVFAHAGSAIAPADPVVSPVAQRPAEMARAAVVRDLVPGRGLAAPPPPATAPPALI